MHCEGRICELGYVGIGHLMEAIASPHCHIWQRRILPFRIAIQPAGLNSINEDLKLVSRQPGSHIGEQTWNEVSHNTAARFRLARSAHDSDEPSAVWPKHEGRHLITCMSKRCGGICQAKDASEGIHRLRPRDDVKGHLKVLASRECAEDLLSLLKLSRLRSNECCGHALGEDNVNLVAFVCSTAPLATCSSTCHFIGEASAFRLGHMV
mmetsp:Transcript_17387/g.40586  ORF Transcript_17387/g.40586 Transcript_17387/m.40586 type:complete len:209 (-) Transcript_17387:2708-3334(-)